MKYRKKPVVNERFADNGAHSHWELLDAESGEIIWSEGDREGVDELAFGIFQYPDLRNITDEQKQKLCNDFVNVAGLGVLETILCTWIEDAYRNNGNRTDFRQRVYSFV